jgi:hypothetical protein
VQPPNLSPITVTSLTAEDLTKITDALARISAGIALLQPYLADVNGTGQAAPVAKRPVLKTPMNDDTLLSREQLARRWGCCIETIKRRERAGQVAFCTVQ